jgi:hypothetical protein
MTTSPTELASVLQDSFLPVEDTMYTAYPYNAFDTCSQDAIYSLRPAAVVDSEASSMDATDSPTLLTTEVIFALKVDGVERLFCALLDYGTSRSLISKEAATRANLKERPNEAKKNQPSTRRYQTTMGTFQTHMHATVR